MLKLVDRTTRREFLRAGSLALGGLASGGLGLGRGQLPTAANALAAAPGGLVTDKSVIFLFLHGGPPQIELFDPKMDAPAEVRSTTGEVATSIPGITFGGTLTQLAQRAHQFSVVRSFRTGDGNHDIKPLVGKESAGAALGSIYARVAGANHPESGLPRNIGLFPKAVDAQAQSANQAFGKFAATGSLGAAYAPFMPGGDGEFQRDLVLNIAPERLADRRMLLSGLDSLRRGADRSPGFAALERSQQQAFDTILGDAAKAFDWQREEPHWIARYDTAGLIDRNRISTKWNNHRNYADHVQTLGKLLLLARRLCEAGAGFVTVTTNFVWDFHADVNNASCHEGMTYCGLPLDHAVSALIDDLAARGLTDKILLVVCGEMGRTPRINAAGGRDHWGNLAPLLLHGGGIPAGHVVGQSTRDAGEPAADPVHLGNLVATILHTLIDVGRLRTERGLPADVMRTATAYEPIAGLV